jgi:hypothetical protein
MTKTRNYMGPKNYIALVKNALGNSVPKLNYVTDILVPQIPGSVQNLLARGNVSFYYGEPTNKTRARIMANLEKAGLSTNSATNLIRKLVKNSSPVRASPSKRKRTPHTNERPPETLRRSGRSTRRL